METRFSEWTRIIDDVQKSRDLNVRYVWTEEETAPSLEVRLYSALV